MGWNRHSKQADLREALDGFDSLYLDLRSNNGIKKGSGAPEIQQIESVAVTTETITHQAKAKIAPKDRPKGRLYHKPRPSQADLDEAAGGRDPIDEACLPFIEPEEVEKHNNRETGIWIVVEDRVYDCTDFLDKFHPGSPETILEFAGKQCTWQFWRFHNKNHLRMWSSALLIGYTDPPPNPYPEPPRWVKTH